MTASWGYSSESQEQNPFLSTTISKKNGEDSSQTLSISVESPSTSTAEPETETEHHLERSNVSVDTLVTEPSSGDSTKSIQVITSATATPLPVHKRRLPRLLRRLNFFSRFRKIKIASYTKSIPKLNVSNQQPQKLELRTIERHPEYRRRKKELLNLTFDVYRLVLESEAALEKTVRWEKEGGAVPHQMDLRKERGLRGRGKDAVRFQVAYRSLNELGETEWRLEDIGFVGDLRRSWGDKVLWDKKRGLVPSCEARI